mgnify:CR=1 FL=1
MNKKEYEFYKRALDTGAKFEKLYFKQKEELKKLYDYIIVRKAQLEYSEAKEETEFIASIIQKIIKEDSVWEKELIVQN